MTTNETIAKENQPALDFSAATLEGNDFKLSTLKGKKIFISFLRNGACALCNLRVRELSQHQDAFDKANIQIIAVFESSIDDMKPFVGKQKLGFPVLSDPGGKIYAQYGLQISEEMVNRVIASGSAAKKVEEAAAAGFPLTRQDGSNFYRIPADVFVNENFEITKMHHAEQLINHLSIDEVLKY